MNDFVREALDLPPGYDRARDRLLLHSCCAPCSGEVLEAIIMCATPESKATELEPPQMAEQQQRDLREAEAGCLRRSTKVWSEHTERHGSFAEEFSSL